VKTSGLDLVLGIWLLVSPAVLFRAADIAAANAVLFGIAIIVVSAWSLGMRANNVVRAWMNLVIGGWMAVSGWVLGYADVPAVLWNGLIVGLLLMFFAVVRTTPRAGKRLV
jgi:hypothetical protein